MSITIKAIVIVLIFILAGALFFHNFTSINADIGRHIKLGEIIWETGEVPKINLFSFTASDYPFINHHWLSEVIFYGTYTLGDSWMSGLKAVMVLKIIVLLAVYLLLFLIVKKRNIFSVVFAFLVSIFIFSARTEPRPEMFSYLFFATYLLVLYRTRTRSDRVPKEWDSHSENLKNPQGRTFNYLWFLPILQLFWVNMHIYFIIGPILFLFFLIDYMVNKNKFSIFNFQFSKLLIIGGLIILANFVNPNFIAGALYPFKVLNNYGYSVVENGSLFFLAKYFGQWAPQDKLFLVSFVVLVASFIPSFWRGKFILLKTRIFDLLLVAMTATLSFKMQRNIPLFALSVWPVMAENLSGIFKADVAVGSPTQSRRGLRKLSYFLISLVLMASIYLVISGRFYRFLDSSKIFGLNVSSAAQDGTDFIKANNIQGPVFNNFDIGSYLIWQLYPIRTKGSQGDPTSNGTGPEQRVFVDGRPEAYPVEFFENIYKPMQRDERVWEEMSLKYGINYVFFAHTDMAEWANEFLNRINKDSEWPMVFLNDAVVIFVKNNMANKTIIGKYKIADYNIEERISSVLARLSKKDSNAFVNLGNVLYRFGWLGASAQVYERLIINQPDNPYGYQGAGYAYASMNDPATQEKAAQNLKKTIDLGFRTFNNYFTLGIIYANLGDFFAAEENIKKALEINPDNQNAKQALKVIRKKQGINF